MREEKVFGRHDRNDIYQMNKPRIENQLVATMESIERVFQSVLLDK